MRYLVFVTSLLLFTGCNESRALTPKETADKIAECEQYNLHPLTIQDMLTYDVIKVVCVPNRK